MRKKVRPSEIQGRILAPPSKSYAQRAVAIGALAGGTSEILYPGNSDDVNAAINVVSQLGARVERFHDRVILSGGLRQPAGTLDCGEAGLGIRMFSSIAAILSEPVTLTGRGSLLKRPMNVVRDSLEEIGVKCETNGGYLPLTVCGPIQGGVARVDGSFSSQVLTGMLMAGPYSQNDLKIQVNDLRSRPYIDITLDVMRSFGVDAENDRYTNFYVRSGQLYRSARYTVEGDWSGAAFMLVAGALCGEVTIDNLEIKSPQADRAIVDALQLSGAAVSAVKNEVRVEKAPLKAFSFNATDCPDLFPPLASLAAYCRGETRIRGVGRLIHKESNRAGTLKEEFGKMGIAIEIDNSKDEMVITGGTCRGGSVSSHGDHRIAMACAIAALASGNGAEIEDAEAVAKSYPGFFNDLELLTKR